MLFFFLHLFTQRVLTRCWLEVQTGSLSTKTLQPSEADRLVGIEWDWNQPREAQEQRKDAPASVWCSGVFLVVDLGICGPRRGGPKYVVGGQAQYDLDRGNSTCTGQEVGKSSESHRLDGASNVLGRSCR